MLKSTRSFTLKKCLKLFNPTFFYLVPAFHLTNLQGNAIYNEHTLGNRYLANVHFPGIAYGILFSGISSVFSLHKAHIPSGLSSEVFLNFANQWLIYSELLSLYCQLLHSVPLILLIDLVVFVCFLLKFFVNYLNNIMFFLIFLYISSITNHSNHCLRKSTFIEHLLNTRFFSGCWKYSIK